MLQQGAPNLRAVPGTNVYGVGLPTVAGICATLAHVGAAPSTAAASGDEVSQCNTWHGAVAVMHLSQHRTVSAAAYAVLLLNQQPGCHSCQSRYQVTAVWHNMREEVCIYINGRPYVLREEERPFKNMQVYIPATPCKQWHRNHLCCLYLRTCQPCCVAVHAIVQHIVAGC